MTSRDERSLSRIRDDTEFGQPPEKPGIARLALVACLVGASAAALLVTGVNVYEAATNRDDDSCPITNYKGRIAYGVVVTVLAPSQNAAVIADGERRSGGPINPAYISSPRVLVAERNGTRRVGVVIPAGANIKVGDHIAFQTGHRDRTMPCNYVPNLMVDAGSKP